MTDTLTADPRTEPADTGGSEFAALRDVLAKLALAERENVIRKRPLERPLAERAAAERVAAGAVLLDCWRPGWADVIDVGTLAAASCDRCILGQAYGSFAFGAIMLFGSGPEEAVGINVVRFGFEADVIGGVTYDLLDGAWRAEIEKRREAQ